jgi:hypothetical protein
MTATGPRRGDEKALERMSDSVKALGEIAGDVLQRIVRELLARKAGGHLIEARLEEIELRLPLALRADPADFADDLVGTLDRILDDAIQHAAAFRPGRAFCHRCAQAGCEHSVPPSCREVFVGYAPTGVPLWKDFAQHCLDLKHPEVDRLYDEPPAFLTWVQAGDELRRRLLTAFRSPSYELFGQIAAGFFPVKTRQEEGRGVLALTFQVVGSRGRRDRRLALNLLGVAPSGEELETLWERYREVPWMRAVRWAQSALASIRIGGRRRRGSLDDREVDVRIEGILRGMARRLEREHRARSRRTHHAEHRHESGRRPTRNAIDDIRAAGPDAILVDERSGTVVVLGDRGRTHFFTAEGRLVSSVRYSPDAIERKRKSANGSSGCGARPRTARPER